MFLMLRIPDAACYYYSFDPSHPNPVIRGHIIVSVLWTGTFLTLLGMRRIWARYVLIVFLAYVSFISGIVVSMLILLPDILLGPSIALTGGFVAYFSAMLILIFSRDIDRLANRT